MRILENVSTREKVLTLATVVTLAVQLIGLSLAR